MHFDNVEIMTQIRDQQAHQRRQTGPRPARQPAGGCGAGHSCRGLRVPRGGRSPKRYEMGYYRGGGQVPPRETMGPGVATVMMSLARELAQGTQPNRGLVSAPLSEIFEVDHGTAGLLGVTSFVGVVGHPGGRPGPAAHPLGDLGHRPGHGLVPREELSAPAGRRRQIGCEEVRPGTRSLEVAGPGCLAQLAAGSVARLSRSSAREPARTCRVPRRRSGPRCTQ